MKTFKMDLPYPHTHRLIELSSINPLESLTRKGSSSAYSIKEYNAAEVYKLHTYLEALIDWIL